MTPDLAPLIAALREAARFVRSHPDETTVEAERLATNLFSGSFRDGRDFDFGRTCDRLSGNLAAAVRVVRSNPDMLVGYLVNVADELEAVADRERKERGDG
jgi:hypothetical protein